MDYSGLAADYDAVRANEALDREYWLAALKEVGRLRPGQRILDLGAGTGRFARLLSEFASVVALDISPEMLRRSLGKGDFERLRADAHHLPFQRDAFDATVAIMVLHQLSEYPAALLEVARVSRSIVIATTDMRARDLGIMEEAFPSLMDIDRARFPPIEEIGAALRGAGFLGTRVESRTMRRLFPVSEQLDRVRRKYISTLDLIPHDEFERGVAFLERELPRRYGAQYEVTAIFSFVGASR